MLTDSHCHLASCRYTSSELGEIIGRAIHSGVRRLVTLSTCLDDIAENLALADNPAVHACIGIHPCDVHHAPDDAVDQLARLTSDPRVCALGETGLDYFHPAPDGWEEATYHSRQRHFLHQHFQIAAASGLNVVIHTRDREGDASFQDALTIYQEYRSTVRAVFHCYVGTWENAMKVFDAGGVVSFGGVATFKNAGQVRDVATRSPAGSFMVETDSPYLAPEPFRGQRNEPAWVRHTAVRIAELRGESLDELALHTEATVTSFFRLRADSI